MIKRADLFVVPLTFQHPVVTAHAVLTTRRTLILRLETIDGAIGYGEGVAFETPWYTSETLQSTIDASRLMLHLLKGVTVTATSFQTCVASLIGHPMAKAMFESALWEVEAARSNQTLKRYLEAGDTVKCGRTIGIGLLTQTVNAVGQALEDGFERIKLKASPQDLLPALQEIRSTFPDAPLMIDLNGSASTQSIDWFKQVDAHRLLMIEQPYPAGHWVESAQLQQTLSTPVCLDESITSLQDVETMRALDAGRIINIKPARVGGLSEAMKLRATGVPYWVGGMYESSIGRYHTLLFASLEGAAYPADMSGTSAYFETDLLDTPLEVEQGVLHIPDHVAPDWKTIEQSSEQIISLI